jgi:hypothetical protein
MKWLKLIPIAANLAMLAWSLSVNRDLNRELRQARLLQKQMEEDHATLVRNSIKVSNMLAPQKRGPGTSHLP